MLAAAGGNIKAKRDKNPEAAMRYSVVDSDSENCEEFCSVIVNLHVSPTCSPAIHTFYYLSKPVRAMKMFV